VGKAAAPVGRVDADVRPVQPVPVRLVRGQPAALDDVAERVVRLLEVEVQPDGRSRRHDPLVVEADELPLGKQLQVLAVVGRLEPLVVGQRRENHPLQFLELLGVVGACRGHDQAVRQDTVVGQEGAGHGISGRISAHSTASGGSACP
jgi:hypothetical protein